MLNESINSIKKNNEAIGVFDSGLGGLMAVHELFKILPNENIVYFGDTGRVPYGTRSRQTIIKYAMQDVSFLSSLGIKMIIAACGTVSSVAKDLNHMIKMPFTGVVEPAARAAYKSTRNGKIGVIGTSATIASGSYKNELLAIDKNLKIFQKDCPLFVPLVENGFVSPTDPIVLITVERYLSYLKTHNIDTLILGCTHYPMISQAIKAVMGEDLTLIDAGREAAIFAAETLKGKNLLNKNQKNGKHAFYVSDKTQNFSKVASSFLGIELHETVQQNHPYAILSP